MRLYWSYSVVKDDNEDDVVRPRGVAVVEKSKAKTKAL